MGAVRKLVCLVVFAAAIFASAPAWAGFYANDKNPTDPNRAQILALAAEIAGIPKSFGCEFAWGQMNDPSSASMEFVPHGDDVRAWTRLVTITTVALPPKQAEQIELLKKLQAIMTNSFTQRGHVLEIKSGANAKGVQTLFVEYETGQGAAKEHNAAGIVRLRADMAAIVQIQSRGKPLARADADKMKVLAIPMTQN